jgi:hypothetical protein
LDRLVQTQALDPHALPMPCSAQPFRAELGREELAGNSLGVCLIDGFDPDHNAGASSTPGVPHPALVGPNEGAVASVTLHHHSRGQPAEANSFLRQYLFACP